jgi:phosphoglycolate phosphatase
VAARPLPVTTVLFDLDGTLADSAGDLALALNRVRAEHGLPPVPAATLRGYASSGARGLLYAGMGVTPNQANYGELRDAFLAHYTECLAETTRLYPELRVRKAPLAHPHIGPRPSVSGSGPRRR